MKKAWAMATVAFVLLAGVVAAFELERHELRGGLVTPPVRAIPGGGEIVIRNYDWITYYIEIRPERQSLRIRTSGAGRLHNLTVVLPPGLTVRIPSHQTIWTLEGNNGRRLNVGVHRGRSVDVDLVPDGRGDMIGMEAIVSDRSFRTSAVLITWEQRMPSGRPRPRPPFRPSPPPPSRPQPGRPQPGRPQPGRPQQPSRPQPGRPQQPGGGSQQPGRPQPGGSQQPGRPQPGGSQQPGRPQPDRPGQSPVVTLPAPAPERPNAPQPRPTREAPAETRR